jgi:hypothetical protein
MRADDIEKKRLPSVPVGQITRTHIWACNNDFTALFTGNSSHFHLQQGFGSRASRAPPVRQISF